MICHTKPNHGVRGVADWHISKTEGRRSLVDRPKRLIAPLPLITAVENRPAVIREVGTPELTVLTSRIADWVATANEADTEAQELVARGIKAAVPELGPASSWTETVVESRTWDLTELVAICQECIVLSAAIRAFNARTRDVASHLITGAKPRVLQVDKGTALLSATVAALTVVGAAAFSIAIQWESAAFAVGTAALCCSLFATADHPTLLVKDLIFGFLIGLPLPLFYEFVILAGIDGFVMLSVVLFPIVTVLGLLLTHPKLYIKALGAMTLGCSQASSPACQAS
jgi:uncharacterized membrane protein YccC